MSLARRLAALGILAVFALQWLWHGFLMPPDAFNPWLAALLFSLPILPAVILVALRHRQAGFWGGVAALFYFCHGIADAWAIAGAWPLALTETGLSLWIVLAANWDGMHARFRKSKAATPTV